MDIATPLDSAVRVDIVRQILNELGIWIIGNDYSRCIVERSNKTRETAASSELKDCTTIDKLGRMLLQIDCKGTPGVPKKMSLN